MQQPSKDNGFLKDHIILLRDTLLSLTGIELAGPEHAGKAFTDEEVAEFIYHAPFIVVSHTPDADPVFNYANLAAQKLFEMTWDEFTSIPSRLSAEPVHREERDRILYEVTTHGYIKNYSGIRISKNGKRFRIEDTTVWNLYDNRKIYRGQAAIYSKWAYL